MAAGAFMRRLRRHSSCHGDTQRYMVPHVPSMFPGCWAHGAAGFHQELARRVGRCMNTVSRHSCRCSLCFFVLFNLGLLRPASHIPGSGSCHGIYRIRTNTTVILQGRNGITRLAHDPWTRGMPRGPMWSVSAPLIRPRIAFAAQEGDSRASSSRATTALSSRALPELNNRKATDSWAD